VTIFFAGVAAGQPQWSRPGGLARLTDRYGVALAGDSARNRVVLFGGVWAPEGGPLAETWEWDGTTWQLRLPATSPPPRVSASMCFDAARNRVVLFGGGIGGVTHADTWEWDGTAWLQRFPAAFPSPRMQHAMAYDPARGRTVLFGGTDGLVFHADTWEWDGTNWNRLAMTGPAARSLHAMAWDAARGRTVLFGGVLPCTMGPCTILGDTWEWDGTTWTQRAAGGPSPRKGHVLVADPARQVLVLSGGETQCPPPCSPILDDTWEWNGTTWAQRSPAVRYSGRVQHGGAFDAARGVVLLFGGTGGSGWSSETWSWNGTDWALDLPEPVPPGVSGPALAFDPGRRRSVVLTGRYLNSQPTAVETWEWDGSAWLRRFPAHVPPPRINHALVQDHARGRTVLFGGFGAGAVYLNDTWEWDGTDWTQRFPAVSPNGHDRHAMAYDAARQKVVLFSGAFSDATTWDWDGTNWTAFPPAPGGPPARTDYALAYDPGRRRTVLFGGARGPVFGDTWEWDGTVWALRTPPVSPPARLGPAMIHDPARGRIVLFGGQTAPSARLADLWEWDGLTWTQRTATGPSARTSPALAFDASRGRAVLFGGSSTNGVLQDVWELAAPCDVAGPGHPGGGLAISCTGSPRIGQSFCVTFSDPPPQGTGASLLFLAPGPPLNPALALLPPAVCAPGFLYAIPVVVLQAVGDPAVYCFAVPPVPLLAGVSFTLQGAAFETAGCFRASDALVVTLQP
jgi:hypothetical protein